MISINYIVISHVLVGRREEEVLGERECLSGREGESLT
jgi:hypothetical protein